jgi:hypothetical protein
MFNVLSGGVIGPVTKPWTVPKLAGCGKTISAQQSFDGLHVWDKERMPQQDVQKVRPARPQRAKRRGVRFGTLSL